MPYTIWQTNHPINQTVTSAFARGIQKISETGKGFNLKPISMFSKKADVRPCISYGILRGTGLLFQACRDNGVEFWEIDRGFWNASHYDGYYRISLGGMNPDYVSGIAQKFRAGCIIPKIEAWQKNNDGHILFCPPSKYVKWFYDLPNHWEQETLGQLARHADRQIIIRDKDSVRPIEADFAGCYAAVTHSSNIALDALRNGIPAICVGKHPIKDWNGFVISDIEKDLTNCDRTELFNFLSWQQYNLLELSEGYPWEAVQAMQKYRSVYLGGGN